MKRSLVIGIIVGIIVVAVTAYLSTLKYHDSDSSVTMISEGHVTDVIDGDTIEVEHQRIRLSLTSTPELNEDGGIKAKEFTSNLCPLGSTARVIVDGGQPQDKYGRTIAKIYCGDVLLNSALLNEGLAVIDTRFCSVTVFATEDWAKKYGCEVKTQDSQTPTPTPSNENRCDSSYPDVCMPPYPPDLDCGDIPYKNFRVLPPDPHEFDRDKDGIGCEK